MYYAIIFQKGQAVFEQRVQQSKLIQVCYGTAQEFDKFNKNLIISWSRLLPVKLFSHSAVQAILLLYGNPASIIIFK